MTNHLYKRILLMPALLTFGVSTAAESVVADSLWVTTEPAQQLHEVVVTAQESRRPTSASVIDTMAMKHLQPSSFSDLLELLPGNVTVDPDMSQVNTIALRQAAGVGQSDDYATSALGTLFVVDGMPLNTNAQMQTSPDAEQAARVSVGRGVDMRRISTDDIEQVEIVRGIAPVEYGELTSGMVKITRRSGVSRVRARFKADNQSRLFYLGKGFALGKCLVVNTSLSWLDARIDPRNARENYKRLGATLRSDLHCGNDVLSLQWNSALDYTGTFETDNNDPDLTVNGTIDNYSRRDHTLSWCNELNIKPIELNFFRGVTISAGASGSLEHLSRLKHVASSRIMPLPVSMTPGSNYVDYLPMLYLSEFDVYGRPVTAYAKAGGQFRYSTDALMLSLNVGAEWNFSKNYGRGEVYDPMRPLVAGNSTRPRPFSDIPAMNQMSAYARAEFKCFPGQFTLGINPGVRLTSLLGLPGDYYLTRHVYADPRATAVCVFPKARIAGYPFGVELTAGIGRHSKMPVAAYLFPNLLYSDFEQLNYYHDDAAYRSMNVMTYVEDLTNCELRAARNLKWELRSDLSYRGNRLSVTYFRENMSDGFRHGGAVRRYVYNRYDASGFDPYAAGRAPRIEDLPYTQAVYQTVCERITNGSRTAKQGVEFTLQTRRVPSLRTRLTVTGAWLITENSNSDPLWYKPAIVIGGSEMQYIGLYDDRDGSRYESCNTNFLFDTDIPRLKLNFSIGVQNMWYTSRQTLRKDGVPTHYIDPDGALHPFTEADMADPYLGQLVRRYAGGAFDKITVPTATAVNLKATKTFWNDRIGLALYVNRLLAIMPDYERYGVTIRRFSSPYFGMELNLKI